MRSGDSIRIGYRVLEYVGIIWIALISNFPSWRGEFVFDDESAVLKNADVWSSSIADVFRHDFWGANISSKHSHKSYRPLTVLTFRADAWLSGYKQDAAQFHATNVLIHIAVCLLYKVAIYMLTGSHRISTVAAILFSAHPIHTEAVSGVVGRGELTSALCYLLAIIVWCRAQRSSAILVWCRAQRSSAIIVWCRAHRRLAIIVWCISQRSSAIIVWCRAQRSSVSLTLIVCGISAVAMLCKEQGVTVLGVCLCYEVIQLGDQIYTVNKPKHDINNNNNNNNNNNENNNNNNKRVGMSFYAAPLIRMNIIVISIVVLLYARYLIMNSETPVFKQCDNPASFANCTVTRILSYNYLYFLNAWLLLNPWMLCFDWSMDCIPLITGYTDTRNIYSLLLWLVILLLVYRGVGSRDIMLLQCIIAIVVPYLPASNLFIRVGFVIAERVLYIPSMGYCWLIAIGVNKVLRHLKSHIVYTCILCVVVVFTTRSWIRSTEWISEYTLYMSGATVCPNNAKVQYNIGKKLADIGEANKAEEYYREAIRLHPTYDQALNNLGNILRERGQVIEAMGLHQRAVEANSQFAAGWMNLGIAQMDSGSHGAAEQSFINAIRIRNNYPDAYYNLGNLHVKLDNLAKAELAYRESIRLKSDHLQSLLNLAICLENTNRLQDADRVLIRAMQLHPLSSQVLYSRANLLGKQGAYSEGEELYLKAISIEPGISNYYGNLGVLYHLWGRLEEAEYYYNHALALEPSNTGIRNNYRKLTTNRTNQ